MGGWIVVASADHAAVGRDGGFVQANHGKAAPLARMKEGDRVAVYAPVATYQGRESLQSFVAFGRIGAGAPFQADMGGGFAPWRRPVAWVPATPAPIRPLLGSLALTAGRRNWGAPFRFGLVAAADTDLDLIARAMGLPQGA